VVLSVVYRSSPSKDLEVVVLRHQLSVLRRQVRRPASPATSRLLPRISWSACVVTPATLLRWHRLLIAQALDQ
jgi:hypothetical protein